MAFGLGRASRGLLPGEAATTKNVAAIRQAIETIAAVEEAMKKAEPKVDMIFLKTASPNNTSSEEMNPKHIG
ncbi:MAG TPA: hypothetical protein VK308_11780 [Pyrinomonadaceae bacterium]|nr:hypothetical protein [Pyrinomonadaceae bacterium]